MYLLFLFLKVLLGNVGAQLYTPTGSDGNGDITQPGPCPGYLPPFPGFEFPHLMIPISTKAPNTAFPNTDTPYITAGDIEMIFNFDIPVSRKGQTCNMEFLFPNQTELSSTASFQPAGVNGSFVFSLSVLGGGAVEGNTTYNNQPLQSNPHGLPKTLNMEPGHAYAIGSTICVPGRISITMSSTDSSLTWFQDWNQCAIGLFITYSP
ncbi:uncharacterized protein Z520_07496 [Fonsecaea multimorphosa CBS 102226]|uniref:Ubiquitin 3 binding protein But2 C-terminal domain-containing protein n=1 Tax=Fonsecaea multimorphosa CBS 102226 TaxID=1442371 RepID=A0A0D2IIB5_9EURO|nr:uncharacterized protein Z520_07496 [Fonsecaea multimorphosa CBS 102226]KIX96776.1 hypothetical protein Z520_07496 [Fonsecaea multimorphosa CBS 102226]OAL22456.1 hypothetical protein AYO22_07014 [Fonsecaea multimorphosa]